MEEADFRIQIRLLTLETLVQRIFAVQTFDYPDDAFNVICQSWIAGAQAEVFAGAPPEQGDLWSGEIADQLQSLLQGVREVRERMKAAR